MSPPHARHLQPLPAGLAFQEELLTPAEEREVVAALERLEFGAVVMHGQTARRTVRHYGLGYAYESRQLTPTEPLPAELEPMRERAATLAGVEPEALAQTLVTRYPPGATIGWHRDAPPFGVVAGVSLLAPARMRFQRGTGEERIVAELLLPPRSAYVLAGEARTAWQHSIPAVRELRYSVSFRTLRNPARWLGDPAGRVADPPDG